MDGDLLLIPGDATLAAVAVSGGLRALWRRLWPVCQADERSGYGLPWPAANLAFSAVQASAGEAVV
jgi:hypothetical protein